MKKLAYLPLFMAALLASCTEPIEFNAGEVSPYVVLVSRPVSDSMVCVHLSHSRFFLDYTIPDPVADASVTLEVNGIPSTGTYNDDAYNGYGAYLFNVRPKAGDTLHVSASIPGHDGLVSAGTRVPAPPDFEVLEFLMDTGQGASGMSPYGYYSDNFYFKLRFKVKSHNDDEFYKVSIYLARLISDGTDAWWDTTYFTKVDFIVNDPIVNSSNMEDVLDGYDGSFWGDEMSFSSEQFVDNEHEFSAQFDIWPNRGIIDFSGLKAYVVIQTLSPELYRYERTANWDDDFFGYLFGEPVQVFCNVEGGIGIFGATSISRSNLPSPRFEHFPHNDGYYYKSLKNKK